MVFQLKLANHEDSNHSSLLGTSHLDWRLFNRINHTCLNQLVMKAKDLIKALKALDPEANVLINIKQSNKANGVVQLPISYGYGDQTEKPDGEYTLWLNSWVNRSYSGSITVHLPDGAFISRLPK